VHHDLATGDDLVIIPFVNTIAGDDYRQIFVDGRELPKDPNPTWRGYSVGRWEADRLVVETGGFNDSGWLDAVGHRPDDYRVIRRGVAQTRPQALNG
jgi:hypothetical protein